MTLINKIINHNNDSYIKAKSCLSKIKDRLTDLAESYPDVTPNELVVLKDVWKELPSNMGKNIFLMGIELKDGFKSILTHYKKDGELFEHNHEEYELNKIIKGKVTNKITGETYNDGDSFIIKKNEKHHLVAENESYVISVLTNDESLLITPKLKPILLKYFNNSLPG